MADEKKVGRLDGKRALILGATAGNLGEAIARCFVEAGARVVIASRTQEAADALGTAMNVPAFACDITDHAAIDRMVRSASEVLGGIDVGVNSTGWGLLKPFLEMTDEDLRLMSAIQFNGPFEYFQALVREMTQGGSIIQISSVTATIMMENHAAYMGTKAGIDHVVRTIANEFGAVGIRANSVAPNGIQDTPMSGGGLYDPAMQKLYAREIPLVRPCVSEDVANVALWLASDESAYVTGQMIHVSGGQTLRRNPSIADIMGLYDVQP